MLLSIIVLYSSLSFPWVRYQCFFLYRVSSAAALLYNVINDANISDTDLPVDGGGYPASLLRNELSGHLDLNERGYVQKVFSNSVSSN